MKRCPKCNRTFPDENQKFCTIDGGLLVTTQQAFDPNATIQGTSANLGGAPSQPTQGRPTSSELRDLNATIASSSSAPTVVFPKQTGPTGMPTSADLPPPPLPQSQSAPLPPPPVAPAKKKSKLPLILGILLVLLVLGVGAVVAAFFLVIKPRLKEMQPERPVVVEKNKEENANNNVNANTAETKTEPEFVPPPNTVKFTNSQANLEGKLAEHYLDFSFYYPKTWVVDPRATSNFVKIEKTREDDKGVYLLESASVSWYNSSGTFEADKDVFQDRVKSMESQIASSYPGYEKISEGETKVNSLKAYEFRFKGTYKNTGQGDLPYWGRVIFVPAGEGEKSGAVISLLATSLASDVSSAEDLGVKGEMPVILESFRFGKNL